MKVRLIKTFHFEAAHRHTHEDALTRAIHGHRFYVHVFQSGTVDEEVGWLIDYGDIKSVTKPIIEQLDHRYLNEILENVPPPLGGGLGSFPRPLEGKLSSSHCPWEGEPGSTPPPAGGGPICFPLASVGVSDQSLLTEGVIHAGASAPHTMKMAPLSVIPAEAGIQETQWNASLQKSICEGDWSGTKELALWIEKQLADSLPFPVQVKVEVRERMDCELNRVPADRILDLPERTAFRFEAAHSLPKTPVGHKCRRLHGHSYELQVVTRQESTLFSVLQSLFQHLDHQWLNQLKGLENPTAEQLSRWVWEELTQSGLQPVGVIVGETCESRCIYTGT